MPKLRVDFEASEDYYYEGSKRRGQAFLKRIREQIDIEMKKLAQYIVSSKLSGQVLNKQSGRLAASVKPLPIETVRTFDIIGGVSAGGPDIPYAFVHEYGGTKSYTIIPKGRALRFEASRLTFQYKSGEERSVSLASLLKPYAQRSYGKAAVSRARAAERDGGNIYTPRAFRDPEPKRSYMHSAFEEKRREITYNVRAAAFRWKQK